MPIPVPGGDPFFDPLNTGMKFLPMYRSIYDPNTGIDTPREHINLVTAWHDGSQVYGSSDGMKKKVILYALYRVLDSSCCGCFENTHRWTLEIPND
jgi:hypothetical protein